MLNTFSFLWCVPGVCLTCIVGVETDPVGIPIAIGVITGTLLTFCCGCVLWKRRRRKRVEDFDEVGRSSIQLFSSTDLRSDSVSTESIEKHGLVDDEYRA